MRLVSELFDPPTYACTATMRLKCGGSPHAEGIIEKSPERF